MASEMKGELADALTASGAGSEGVSSSPSTVRDSTDHADRELELAELGVDSASPPVGDDEDVSLEELMMSDSPDEEEEATDVHAAPDLGSSLLGSSLPEDSTEEPNAPISSEIVNERVEAPAS